MKKILFICHGNVCRSPMAEFVMKYLAKQSGCNKDFLIDSAAATEDAIGCDMYRGAKQKLYEMGIPFAEREARLLTPADYTKYDLLIGMDDENMSDMEDICGFDCNHKMHKLLEYCGTSRDVADPWYTQNFDAAFDDIMAGCEGILKNM